MLTDIVQKLGILNHGQTTGLICLEARTAHDDENE